MRIKVRSNYPFSNRLRALWWLHPRFAILFLGVPILLVTYLIPESSYLTLYRTAKYVDIDFLVLGLIIYVALLAGTFLSVRIGTRSQEREAISYCRWVVWPLFSFTVFGYVVWFSSAILRSGGPGPLISALINFLQGQGRGDYVKLELFQTIPGITTFVQFGILYATVEALLWVKQASRRRVALARFTLVFLLTIMRAILLSERLAFVEIAIPVAVVLFSYSRWSQINRIFVRVAPFLGAIAVFTLFAFAEYFRSWSYYRTTYASSYIQFVIERFLGYYATAVNNAAVYYYYEPVRPLRHTLSGLFNFPVLGEAASASYELAFSDGAISHEQLLELYANYEFNNVAPIGLWLNEFSIFWAPLAALFVGIVATSLYRSFVKRRIIGLLLYPSWFIGLLEVSRVYYWSNQRYFPTLAFLVISLLLFRFARLQVSLHYQRPVPFVRRRDLVRASTENLR